MKKIGFIDLFIDEWHANNYPEWIRNSSKKDDFEIAFAWEKFPAPGKKDLKAWCASFGVTPCGSLAEVVAKSDCICVLAPANPETHMELAEVALRSGKPVYVDKPFAPNGAVAREMFALAGRSGTPLMSSSALRFGNELLELKKNLKPRFVTTRGGGGNFPEYAIHQIEMAVSLLGTGAATVTVTGNDKYLTVAVSYADGRVASFNYSPWFGFSLAAADTEQAKVLDSMSNFFPNLLEEILKFFSTGASPIPDAETIEIASILDAVVTGMKTPGKTIAVK